MPCLYIAQYLLRHSHKYGAKDSNECFSNVVQEETTWVYCDAFLHQIFDTIPVCICSFYCTFNHIQHCSGTSYIFQNMCHFIKVTTEEIIHNHKFVIPSVSPPAVKCVRVCVCVCLCVCHTVLH